MTIVLAIFGLIFLMAVSVLAGAALYVYYIQEDHPEDWALIKAKDKKDDNG